MRREVRVTDILTGCSFAVHLERDLPLTYREILDLTLRSPDHDRLDSQASKIQDKVYPITDSGDLLPDIHPDIVLFNGAEFVELDEYAIFDLVQTETERYLLLDLRIDRSDAIFRINEKGLNVRKWRKNEPVFREFVERTLRESLGDEAEAVLSLETPESQRKFLRAVGKRVWDADFELYSRFIRDNPRYKDGSETLMNIIAGRGGICSEKAAAMRMISDAFGIDSEFLLAGPNAIGRFPVEKLREMIDERDFSFGKKYTNYWQHMALLYEIDGEPLMMDVTNGNVPFLFLRSGDAMAFVDSDRFVEVRMAEEIERLFYHRVPQDIPMALLALMRDWVEYIDIVHVFEDALGLLIKGDWFVWPEPYRNDSDIDEETRYWENAAANGKIKRFEFWMPGGEHGEMWAEFAALYPQICSDLEEARRKIEQRYGQAYSDDLGKGGIAYVLLNV